MVLFILNQVYIPFYNAFFIVNSYGFMNSSCEDIFPPLSRMIVLKAQSYLPKRRNFIALKGVFKAFLMYRKKAHKSMKSDEKRNIFLSVTFLIKIRPNKMNVSTGHGRIWWRTGSKTTTWHYSPWVYFTGMFVLLVVDWSVERGSQGFWRTREHDHFSVSREQRIFLGLI